jgi:hypothetical protein
MLALRYLRMPELFSGKLLVELWLCKNSASVPHACPRLRSAGPPESGSLQGAKNVI